MKNRPYTPAVSRRRVQRKKECSYTPAESGRRVQGKKECSYTPAGSGRRVQRNYAPHLYFLACLILPDSFTYAKQK